MTSIGLEAKMEAAATEVAGLLDRVFSTDAERAEGWQRLNESMRYSLLQEGAKRFRPTLSLLTADALGVDRSIVLPFACAVECVHTYSLIHDDLPSMDNDDFRRGKPTNHKKFDEATAILAGDALLTDAFGIVAEAYVEEPEAAVRSILELSRAAGSQGMVGGQAIDMAAKTKSSDFEDLRLLHLLKTGALIRVASVGAAIVAGASEEQIEDLSDYASSLGLAFQVADDILDYSQERPESGSYCALLGPEKTRELLQELTDEALEAIIDWDEKAEPLRELAQFNLHRSR
jgi:geranylgeranyl pyrophosphate synthase